MAQVPAPQPERHLSIAPRPGDAVRVALVAAFESLVEHSGELRRGSTDPEEIHDARVAARQFRSRAVALSSVLDVDAITTQLDDLRGFARTLGDVRDLDVLLEDLSAEADGVPDELRPSAALILAGFADERSAALEAVRRRIEGESYERLLHSLASIAMSPPLRRPEHDPDPAVVMTSAWKAVARRARAARAAPTDETLHALRIRTKRARYAAEALEPFVGKRAARFARAAGQLQDVLGRHQDAVVAIDKLSNVAERDPGLAFAAGWISRARERVRVDTRDAWPKAWRSLARKERRFW